jgi:predicted enzyme related to lactoylglutathione lyase
MPNPLCHFEILVPDPEKAKSFYQNVFDWTFESSPGSNYQVIQTGAAPCGGLMKKPDGMPMRAALQVYILVDNVDETLKKAADGGATVLVPKTEVSGRGYFAVFQDPEGIVLGLFEVAKAEPETPAGE